MVLLAEVMDKNWIKGCIFLFYLMIRSCTIFILLSILLLPVPVNGQLVNTYNTQTFGTRNGLFSSKIYALAQSQNKNLWIGTELGVSIYNGYDFINYQYTAGNESIGRVLCITQDSALGIWIGGDKGLFYCRNGSINKVGLQSNAAWAIEALLTDANGNVWAGAIDALYKITAPIAAGFSKHRPGSIALSPFAAFTKRVFSLAADDRQNIYIGSHNGLFKITAHTNDCKMIWTNPDPHHFVRSVAATSPDSIFWNCLERHPAQMIKGKVTSYYTEDFIGSKVFIAGSKAYALTTNGVGFIENGNVHTIFLFTGITNNATAALQDAEGNFWVGSWEGLQQFKPNNFKQFSLQQSSHKEVFSFLERKNGDLLFGSNRGQLFIKKNDSIIPDKKTGQLFPLAEIMCMYEDAANGLWLGSGYQGIGRLKNNTTTYWKDTGFLKDNNCEDLLEVDDHNIFACTENGVTVIDPLANGPLKAHYPFQKKYTRYPELFGGFKAVDSTFFFYGSTGIYKLRNAVLVDDSITGMPVKNLYVNKIVADKKDNIWIATLGKGLLQCRYQNGRFILNQQYDTRKGTTSDIALSVLVDKNDNIWWGDYMSITVLLNPGNNEQLISFNERDGLLSSYYQTLKLEQQQNGTIWVLTSMGMVSFHPDSISRNTMPPVLMMNKITVNDRDSNYANSSPGVLSYNDNSLQFYFTAVCLTDAGKVRYAYRLKGMDSNWIYTNSRIADFNFLQPGNYTFELKACNNNNVWTQQALQYHYTIKPPFWKTWWFGSIAILLLAGLAFMLFKRRIANVKNKMNIRQQMAELEAKAIRAQMNPHFIFNSLNAIQELIITNNTDEGYRYLSSFSKLLRMVLNNSEKNFIPLSNELEMIKLYLSLESLRFRQSFSYEIVVDENIETDIIQVPSLLLQPYVENAVWHGLRHKEGEKKLFISINEKQQQLQIEIDDNGVGRKRSEYIKNKKLGAEQFESKGTVLAQQRVAILNQQYPGMATTQIIDKTGEDGDALGTKVIISLPINIKN
jgi:ligand-binding sensor domain-containing protein/anti-sigma regulatory factor (Ser/Thr protein kinase)